MTCMLDVCRIPALRISLKVILGFDFHSHLYLKWRLLFHTRFCTLSRNRVHMTQLMIIIIIVVYVPVVTTALYYKTRGHV